MILGNHDNLLLKVAFVRAYNGKTDLIKNSIQAAKERILNLREEAENNPTPEVVKDLRSYLRSLYAHYETLILFHVSEEEWMGFTELYTIVVESDLSCTVYAQGRELVEIISHIENPDRIAEVPQLMLEHRDPIIREMARDQIKTKFE